MQFERFSQWSYENPAMMTALTSALGIASGTILWVIVFVLLPDLNSQVDTLKGNTEIMLQMVEEQNAKLDALLESYEDKN